jgi:thiol-disulfide isomerase/thioredoxin
VTDGTDGTSRESTPAGANPSPERTAAHKPRRWPGVLRDVALFFAMLVALRAYQARDTPSGQAPATVLTALDGRAFDLGVRRERPLLVYFWASWCGVCKRMESSVAGVSADYPVVTVASRSGSAASIAATVARRQLRVPVVPDVDHALARSFGVHAYPTAIVLDPGGQVSSVDVGYVPEAWLRLRLWWAGS